MDYAVLANKSRDVDSVDCAVILVGVVDKMTVWIMLF